ncbi:MAG: ATP phosphoribosyltransferase regulatory subunit, partial [Alphaproteobacteria bacterium]|nr:ATP phosphoribosyltransferase regulatory subunit [Alphaproteobacteria bacterium]
LTEEIGADATNEIIKVFTDGYRSFVKKSENLDLAIAELDNFMKLLTAMGIKNAQIDLGIMRGHAYYTGVVFEFFLQNFPELGAIGGGGRYEDLASKFSKTKIIGVGAAVGFSRLMVALMDEGRIDLTPFAQPIDVAVLVMGENQVVYSMSVLGALRDAGVASVAYLDADKKFKNQIEYSDKINAKFSIIIGEDEVKNQIVAVKNMQTGEQQNMSVADAVKMFKVA